MSFFTSASSLFAGKLLMFIVYPAYACNVTYIMSIIELIVGVWWDPGPNNPTFLTVKPLHVSIEYRVVQQRVVWSEQLSW